MLEVHALSVDVGPAADRHRLLDDLTLACPSPHFGAIIGPSGCGKSTLLKAIAGILPASAGTVSWQGRVLSDDSDFEPSELGYVPQFNITHEQLSVRECLETTLELRVTGLDAHSREQRASELLHVVGLDHVADTRARRLSGGQRRRLALGVELASHPSVLLCDEVTSGLDAKAEDEIVHLLHDLARSQRCLVLNVTHQTRHLDLVDSVTVLYDGRLAYHGPPQEVRAYFDVQTYEEIYPALSVRGADEWADRWARHTHRLERETPEDLHARIADEGARQPVPGPIAQFRSLLARRFTLFLREPGQIWLQLALLLLFPGVVVLFALDGLPQMQNLSQNIDQNIVEQLGESLKYTISSGKVGSLVSGLIMFQVVLLGLMGANNSARAIVASRQVFEKEKLGGVRAGAALTAELVFLAGIVLAQSAWMTLFVKFIVGFPGDVMQQLAMLVGVNAAITSTCLAVSAWAKSTEQASLISVYLVGFQLPLSGAVLTLPAWLNAGVRPLISSYWSWSGYLQTLRETGFYDAARRVSDTPLAPVAVCAWVLLSHTLIGIAIAWLGCRRSQWE